MIIIIYVCVLCRYEDKLPCVKIPAPDHCPVQGQGGGVGFDVSNSFFKHPAKLYNNNKIDSNLKKKSMKEYYQKKLY